MGLQYSGAFLEMCQIGVLEYMRTKDIRNYRSPSVGSDINFENEKLARGSVAKVNKGGFLEDRAVLVDRYMLLETQYMALVNAVDRRYDRDGTSMP